MAQASPSIGAVYPQQLLLAYTIKGTGGSFRHGAGLLAPHDSSHVKTLLYSGDCCDMAELLE